MPDTLNVMELNQVLDAAQQCSGIERRTEQRHPFVAPVTLHFDSPGSDVVAFSRELSCGGIGLLHQQPIAVGTACDLGILAGTVKVERRAECRWCKDVTKEWFISGWQFTGRTS